MLSVIEPQLNQLFRRRDWQQRGQQYLQGLLTTSLGRRNAERLASMVDGASPRALQRFLSEAPWDYRPIIDQVQERLGELLQSEQGVWLLEDIAFAKQGENSAGVEHQATSQKRTSQNCQTGVFLAYASPLGEAYVDMRLYLPHSWNDDIVRRRRVGVPDEIQYQSKAELALMLLRNAQAREQLSSQWVLGPSVFGQDSEFQARLDAEGWWYLLEVPMTLQVFTEKRADACKAQVSLPWAPYPITIREVTKRVLPEHWRRMEGSISEYWTTLRVWEVQNGSAGHEQWLVLRRGQEWGAYSAFLSNAPLSTPLEDFVKIKNAGDNTEIRLTQLQTRIGLREYEVRSWRGWYHHMSLCLLAATCLLSRKFVSGEISARGFDQGIDRNC